VASEFVESLAHSNGSNTVFSFASRKRAARDNIITLCSCKGPVDDIFDQNTKTVKAFLVVKKAKTSSPVQPL